MKKLIPITVVLVGLFAYVYFFHIAPSREVDPVVRGQGAIEVTSYDVAARLSARVLAFEVDEGDPVKKGDVVARLDCADIEARLAQAEAQVEQAEALVEQAEAALAQAKAARRQGAASVAPIRVGAEHAEHELERARWLRAADGIPAKTVDDAAAAVDTAREQLRAARSGVSVAVRGVEVAQSGVDVARAAAATARAAVQTVQVQLGECTLEAPAAGVVIRRNYEPGETVLPGAALVRVGALEDAYTWIYVANEEVGKLRLGQQVKLTADTYPDRAFVGRIVRINEEAEFTPRSIQTKEDRTRLVFGVKVAVDNGDRALMPGMPVEASLVDYHPAAAPAPAASASATGGEEAADSIAALAPRE